TNACCKPYWMPAAILARPNSKSSFSVIIFDLLNNRRFIHGKGDSRSGFADRIRILGIEDSVDCNWDGAVYRTREEASRRRSGATAIWTASAQRRRFSGHAGRARHVVAQRKEVRQFAGYSGVPRSGKTVVCRRHP